MQKKGFRVRVSGFSVLGFSGLGFQGFGILEFTQNLFSIKVSLRAPPCSTVVLSPTSAHYSQHLGRLFSHSPVTKSNPQPSTLKTAPKPCSKAVAFSEDICRSRGRDL